MLYSFFWVIPQRLNFTCRCFGTICCSIFIGKSLKSRIIHLYGKETARHIRLFEKLRIKITSAHKIQTPGNHPKKKKKYKFRTWRNFEIKNLLHVWAPVSTLHHPVTYFSCSIWTRDPFGSRKLRQMFVYLLHARCRWMRACIWGGSPSHNCSIKILWVFACRFYVF
jgi:hypothetical protein